MIRKVLVANRGEIAVRIIKALKEMGIRSVAIYSEPDREALHVRCADEAYCIGKLPLESYLDVDRIVDLAKRVGADAIHPGAGFLSESESFSRYCRDEGLTFIGPSPEVMGKLSDKVEARRIAKKLLIPSIPGSEGEVRDVDEACRIGERLGYPVMLKARAGGGGRGIRVVWGKEEMSSAFQAASEEARLAFNDPSLYIEKLVQRARHIEVQILGDKYGNVVHLFERDCSIQRKHQKIVEESPSPALSDEMRGRVVEYAVRLAKGVGYEGVGTVEFLFDGNEFYFLEVNPRLQVEHPITEMITGVDIVRKQIEIAEGKPLNFGQEDIKRRGHAIEFRICAEDPFRNFFPSPGLITSITLPEGRGVRIDSGVFPYYSVPPYYDTLLMKLIVWGEGRREAIDKARGVLSGLKIKGIYTNIPFHKWLLRQDEFIGGCYHVKFVEERFLPSLLNINEEKMIVAMYVAGFKFLRHEKEVELLEEEISGI